jgi:K+-transporting ATPase ATPase C chain
MLNTLQSTVVIFALLTFVTGIAYPTVVTVLAQTLFPHQANGSLVYASDASGAEGHVNIRDWWGTEDASPNPKAIGSVLIGQPFSSDRCFWGRPSATGPTPYNAAASTGSNYGPTNPAQLDAVKQRVEHLRASGLDASSPVPVDLVTASGSGLDPHITPAAAEYQVPRIARIRGVGEYEIRRVVAENVEGRTLGMIGEPRVNVLRLNLALDRLKSRGD